MLIDLDKHGTPGWLTPIGKFDSTAIRRKHQAAYWAKRKLTKDFNPNHEPAGSPKGGQFVAASSGGANSKEKIRKDVLAVADQMKYPRENIHFSDKSSVLTLNGVDYYSSAMSISEETFAIEDEVYHKGDLVFFNKEMAKEPEIGGVAAHEIEHQKFQSVVEEASDQVRAVKDIEGDAVFKDNGFNPQFKDQYPLAWKMQELGVFGSKGIQLADQDGLTAYSSEYWDEFYTKTTRQTFVTAVHETLAEMSRLKHTGKFDPTMSHPLWIKLFDTVDVEYKKLKNITDYNPYHAPAGDEHGGEFTAAPGGRPSIEEQKNLGNKANWIRQKIDTTADKMNFPKDRVFMSDGDYYFTLNGTQHRAGGIAIYSKDGFEENGVRYGQGDVIVYGNSLTGFDEDLPVTGIVAHEIEHQKFLQVTQRREEELQHMREHNPDVFDEGMIAKGAEEKYGSTYPTFFAMREAGWLNPNIIMKLRDTDGVTDYSKEWWKSYNTGETTSTQTPINETLAEIASLDIQGMIRNPPKDISFDDVEKFVVEDITTDPGYNEEERARAKQDPWEYADAVNRDRFFKRFGVRWDELGFDISKRTVDLPDFTGSSLYKVISPEWKKLYDTINEQYKKMHNITDAGFDENQPRDDEGQWTSGSVLKLGKKTRTVEMHSDKRENWPATKATDELYKTSYNNPLNPREMVWTFDKEGKDLAMLEFGPPTEPDTMYFKHIRTFPQRKGIGRQALKELTDYADEKGVKLWLQVAENSDTPAKALLKLYREFGFEGDVDGMTRPPKTSQ